MEFGSVSVRLTVTLCIRQQEPDHSVSNEIRYGLISCIHWGHKPWTESNLTAA